MSFEIAVLVGSLIAALVAALIPLFALTSRQYMDPYGDLDDFLNEYERRWVEKQNAEKQNAEKQNKSDDV